MNLLSRLPGRVCPGEATQLTELEAGQSLRVSKGEDRGGNTGIRMWRAFLIWGEQATVMTPCSQSVLGDKRVLSWCQGTRPLPAFWLPNEAHKSTQTHEQISKSLSDLGEHSKEYVTAHQKSSRM